MSTAILRELANFPAESGVQRGYPQRHMNCPRLKWVLTATALASCQLAAQVTSQYDNARTGARGLSPM
ncbi:MAG TPA: hypothetical protein VFP91_05465 [Vicinamibacterales bacterium]|nr:hypothetical protein [Vicinamibacterales bacterium]